jgi:type I restriction enzyme, S subunit
MYGGRQLLCEFFSMIFFNMTTQNKTTWQKMKFKDFADTSPSVKLERGKEYPFIPMDVVDGQHKFPLVVRRKGFSGGGSKFTNGDTIFARITPCLENGKIAKVEDLEGGVGFGSTEFFVFRGKEGVSDSDFVYYLSRTDTIRDPAVKSMVGASGRQRADKTVVDNVQIVAPDLPQQKQIADVLSTYDDLIENNTKRIKILEQIAQAIYREWFVEKSKIKNQNAKSQFKVKKMGDVFDVRYGKNLPTSKINKTGKYPVYGAGGVIGFYGEQNSDGKVVLVTCRGNGSGTIWRTRGQGFVTNNSLLIIPKKQYEHLAFMTIYFMLLNANVSSAISGSAQPQITIESLNFVDVVLPPEDLIKQFQVTAKPLFELMDSLFIENQNLRQARDLLLPKLVNGEIKV